MSTAGTAKAWDIRPGETSKQFEAFQEYLLLGPSRSLEATRHKLSKESPGYLRTLKLWASANDWVERARTYDAAVAVKHLGRREKLNLDAEIEKLRADMLAAGERSMRLGERMLALAERELARLESAEGGLKANEIGLMLSRGDALVSNGSVMRSGALGVEEIARGLDGGSGGVAPRDDTAPAGGGEGPPDEQSGGETAPALAESEAAP